MTTILNHGRLGGKTARAFAFTLLALAATLLQAREARAQWTSPDAAGNINSTNTGNVGVGTAAPASRLEVRGTTADANASALNVTDSTGRGLLFVKNNGHVGVGGAYAWNTLSVFTPTGTRGGVSIVGDGNEWNYTDLFMGPASNTGIATGKPINFGFSVMKNNPSYGGDATGPSFALTAQRQGGGSYVPLIINPNGNLILAGASNATNGNVGIGTSAPLAKLDVTTTNALGSGTLDLVFGDSVTANNNPITISHKVGTASGSLSRIGFNIYSTNTNFALVNPSAGGWSMQSDTRNGITAPALQFSSFTTTPIKTDVLTLTQGGNVGIGTITPATALHVVGDVTVSGNISAKYQDVAEWVPSTQKLSAGTVVVVDSVRVNQVLASTASYDTGVAGVISVQPGLILGEGGEGKVMVATTGRVKVRVDATRAPIRAGDLLVTSGVAGVAMRSEPVAVGGVSMHRPGTIVGKALESLEKGTGEILVLLSLQ